MESFLRVALTTITMAIIVTIAKTVAKRDISNFKSKKKIEELRIEYNSADRKLTFIAIGIILLSILSSMILHPISIFFKSFIDDQEILVIHPIYAWLIPGLIGGISAAVFAIHKKIGPYLLKESWNEYMYYKSIKSPPESKNVERGIGFICLFSSLVIILFFFDFYSCFGKHSIKINGSFSLGSSYYKYEDIERIKHITKPIKNSSRVLEFIEIDFKDKYTWNSLEGGFDSFEKNMNIAIFVQEKSMLLIEKIEQKD